MHQRPRIFVFLALLHFLEPLSKILYFKITTRFPLMDILQNVLAIEGLWNNFEFWLLFPLGGLALLSVKSWAYPLFVSVQLYSLWAVLSYQEYTWPYVAQAPHFTSILILAFNVLVITYFLLPGVRRPFYDRRLRWWETKPRFGADIACSVELVAAGLPTVRASILNISHSGAFINMIPGVELGKNVRLEFNHHGQQFALNAVARNRRMMNGIDGLGLEFVYSSWKDNLHMRLFIHRLSQTFKNSYEEKAA